MSEINDPNPNRAPWTNSQSPPHAAGTTTAPYSPTDSGTQPVQKKQGWGCWVWGCLGVIVFMLIAIVGLGFAGYFFWTAQVEKYTDIQPAELPVVEMEEKELEVLENRIESFTNQVRPPAESAEESETAAAEPESEPEPADESIAAPGEPTAEAETESPVRELVLTAHEINALIASKPDLRGRVFVEINDGVVSGQVSFPTDVIPGASGRYFNADAEFDVSMQDGILVVRLTDAKVKGERIPQQLLDGFANENLAKDLYSDPENAEMLRKFESIEVVDDSIVLRLKDPQEPPESDLAPEIQSEPQTENKEGDQGGQ